MRTSKYFLLIVSIGSLAACVAPAGKQAVKSKPLAGSILHVKTGVLHDRQQLIERVLASDYILLGETHDNAYHHQHQAHIINQLSRHKHNVSVSFEMIDSQQGQMLKQHSYVSSAELISILNRSKSNWPYKRDYEIVFDSVLVAGFEILAANINTDRLIQITMQGDENLPADVKQVLKATPFSELDKVDLQNEIIEVHCNMLPANAIQPMVHAQRIRDAIMSLSMLKSSADHRVLIAGSGHVRNDRGVPLYLRSHDQGANIISIAFIGLDEEAMNIDAYKKRWGGQGVPYDYVWFTPAVKRQQDPCDNLRQNHRPKQEHNKKMKEL